MSDRPERLVLATDLDGTLAHGDPALRARLVGWLRARAGALIYVSGRAPEAVVELAERGVLPEPDVLIADVGTSVLRGLGPGRVDAIEGRLGERWPGGDRVRERLAGVADLALQPVRALRRVSYWIEPVRRLRPEAGDPYAAPAPEDRSLATEATTLAASVGAQAAHRLRDLEVDVLVSGNVFLDVLPRGVNKGSTLRRVLAWLGVPDDACVVAGDSLNDLDLLMVGCRGIAVGNCEPALRQRVAGMARVYQARAAGVAGVLEGLRHHGIAPSVLEWEGPDGE